MNLQCVTMTGADETVQPSDLVEVSLAYPHVEWGILVSQSWTANPGARWPGEAWITSLQDLSEKHQLKLSLHICGRWTRNLLQGENQIPAWMLRGFQRVQLNFHRETNARYKPEEFEKALRKFDRRQVIFQIDGARGKDYLDDLYSLEGGVDAAALFDVSGGAGISPNVWTEPYYMTGPDTYDLHGYAGGLGPHNIGEEIVRIEAAAKEAPIWIDMESKIRSIVHGRDLFDMSKVKQVLKYCEPFCL